MPALVEKDNQLIRHCRASEYKIGPVVGKERLRSRSCDVAEVEQLLEDKYLSMKCVKGWEEEEDDYALIASPAKKKGPKKQFKGRCGYYESSPINIEEEPILGVVSEG